MTTDPIAAIREWAAAKEAFDALPEDAHLNPEKLKMLSEALGRKVRAEAGLIAIAACQEPDAQPTGRSELIVLLPCPCCDRKAGLLKDEPSLPNGGKDELYKVMCSVPECGIQTGWWYPVKAAAIIWNQRKKT